MPDTAAQMTLKVGRGRELGQREKKGKIQLAAIFALLCLGTSVPCLYGEVDVGGLKIYA